MFAPLLSAARAQNAATEEQKLTAPKLFPDTTLAYIRISDVQDLRKRLDESSLGQLSSDEKIKPILSEFYGTLVRTTEQMQDAIGLNLDELLSIPTGEFAIGLLPPERRSSRDEEESGRQRVNRPALVMLLDAGEEITSVQVMLQRVESSLNGRFEYASKEMDRLTLHSYTDPNRADRQFAYFIDDGTMIASSAVEYLETMAEDWLANRPAENSLADNGKFVSIMTRCVGTEGERPQVSFFADPLQIVRDLVPKNAGTMLALGMIGPLGIDGIEAVGGSWIVSPPDFDSISHMHLLLESPRKAVLSTLRPKSGSTTPEKWVPDSVGSYSTINWDLELTLSGIDQLLDKMLGEDTLENRVFKPAMDRFGVDIRNDVVGNLEGRISILQGFVRPVTINSGSNVYAFKLKDPEAFQTRVIDNVVRVIEARTEVLKGSAGKLNYRYVKVGRGNTGPNTPVRQPEICFGIHDDYLLIADSKYMITQIAECISGTNPKLLDSIEYQLISERITAQLQEKECSGITYARPEETLQLFYELARDESNRDRLRQIADRNGFFKALLAALEKHDLPPFSVIAKYLAPSGGFLVEEETGMHYMSFSLRR